ncbi:hypothetical protein [Ensifer sp. SSB1]|uniref:hypothetical protein n=1 Tax=Ensifer sp. SSB1 TaxID=2795385 RepID=UPI001A3A77D4|nr:hypothetical protein [Ensifer sp. SSB1]MBK5570104.1 hypothetical protein [Ensifer sp. SSB1]
MPKLSIFSVVVRRDASTSTPVEVPEHEIAMLQTIFGEEHVHNTRHQSIADAGLTDDDAVGEGEFGEGEFDRLAAKYGGNDEGLLVEQVFGKKATKGLEAAMAATGKPKKKGSASKASQSTETEQ